MGRERTGWYGLDVLLNNGIPSATYLRRDLAEPVPGWSSRSRAARDEMEKKRLLVLGGFDLPNPAGGSMDVTLPTCWSASPTAATRLLVRTRKAPVRVRREAIRLLREPLDFGWPTSSLTAQGASRDEGPTLRLPIPREHEISLN
jgi:hypothetical protein